MMSTLPSLTFKYIDKVVIEGQTSSKKESKAEVYRYEISGNFKVDFTCVLQLQKWENGETDITCIEARGSNLLNTSIGRMRLSLNTLDDNKKYYCAFKTAQLKNKTPPHANLIQVTIENYNSLLDINLENFLAQYGKFEKGSREDMFNDKGRHRKMLAFVFNAEEIQMAMSLFVATRIFPLLVNE